MKTKEKLAHAMREAGTPEGMIQSALAGRFDDFESESGTPIIDLVRVLRNHGFAALAQRAVNGEFDGTREEADAWAQAQIDPEMVATLRELRMQGGEER